MINRLSWYVAEKIENVSIENVVRRSAHMSLGFSAIFATLGLVEDGYPSDAEKSNIYHCAANMLDKPYQTSSFNFPEECDEYRGEFETVTEKINDSEYTNYVIPARDTFVDEKIWTSHIEEEREKDFDQSFIFLSLAMVGYGINAFRRRIPDPDTYNLIKGVEEHLRTNSGE